MPKSGHTIIHLHLSRHLYTCESEGCEYRTRSTTGIRLHMRSKHEHDVGNMDAVKTIIACCVCSEVFVDLRAAEDHYRRSGQYIPPL